ncbi:aromatic ring-hydroxylating dioxygenase subunit alpha, partial [Rhizobium phaseoli]
MTGAGAMIDEWYPVGLFSQLTEAGSKTALMGEPIEVTRT